MKPVSPTESHLSFRFAVAVAVFASILSVLFLDEPSNDIASYYAPLAREFAAGNWERAFYNIIPPLVPTLAGILALTGIPAFTALKIVGCTFYVAGLWLFRELNLTIMSPRDAGWACLLYAITPRIMRYSGMGLLTPGKIFFLLWASMCAIQYSRNARLRDMGGLAVSLGLLSLTRGEGIVFVPFFLAWLLVLEYVKKSEKVKATEPGFRKRVIHGLLFAAILFVVTGPQLLYVHSVTGSPALDARQTRLIEKLFDVRLGAEPPPSPYPAAKYRSVEENEPAWPIHLAEQIYKGLFPLYLLLGIVGAVLLTRRRSWNIHHVFFLSIIPYNAMIFVIRGGITKRYVVPTAPFFLFLAVIALKALYDTEIAQKRRRLAGTVAALTVFALVADGLLKVRSALTHENMEKRVGRWINEQRQDFVKADPVKLQPLLSDSEYHNGRQPVIATTDPQFSYWAEGDWCPVQRDVVYSYLQLREYVIGYYTDVLIYNDHMQEVCPEFEENWRVDFYRVNHPEFDDVDLYAPKKTSGITSSRISRTDPQ